MENKLDFSLKVDVVVGDIAGGTGCRGFDFGPVKSTTTTSPPLRCFVRTVLSRRRWSASLVTRSGYLDLF